MLVSWSPAWRHTTLSRHSVRLLRYNTDTIMHNVVRCIQYCPQCSPELRKYVATLLGFFHAWFSSAESHLGAPRWVHNMDFSNNAAIRDDLRREYCAISRWHEDARCAKHSSSPYGPQLCLLHCIMMRVLCLSCCLLAVCSSQGALALRGTASAFDAAASAATATVYITSSSVAGKDAGHASSEPKYPPTVRFAEGVLDSSKGAAWGSFEATEAINGWNTVSLHPHKPFRRPEGVPALRRLCDVWELPVCPRRGVRFESPMTASLTSRAAGDETVETLRCCPSCRSHTRVDT